MVNISTESADLQYHEIQKSILYSCLHKYFGANMDAPKCADRVDSRTKNDENIKRRENSIDILCKMVYT